MDKAQLAVHNANRRGSELEDRVCNILDNRKIGYKYTSNNGIDFIIQKSDGTIIYMDCVSTGVTGSIDEKIPTKINKYVEKYGLQGGAIHILHPYSGLNEVVMESIRSMERLHDIEVHILDWYEFEELIDGNYRPTKKQISTNASKFAVPDTNAIRNFFDFTKCT
tara:strand:+ start:182 stop:676 length:495 start_codon:yes stop_codon:yes gene_type:complete